MTPTTATAQKIEASAQPSFADASKKVVPIIKNRMDQEQAADIIVNAERPVIVITAHSSKSYVGMMKYISESFPQVPIIFEDQTEAQGAQVNDSYMAKHVIKGDFRHQRANAHFSHADAVIIFGKNPEFIQSKINPSSQQILSVNTVQDGVNIAIAALSRRDEFQAKGQQWQAWNTRRISPGRCCA